MKKLGLAVLLLLTTQEIFATIYKCEVRPDTKEALRDFSSNRDLQKRITLSHFLSVVKIYPKNVLFLDKNDRGEAESVYKMVLTSIGLMSSFNYCTQEDVRQTLCSFPLGQSNIDIALIGERNVLVEELSNSYAKMKRIRLWWRGLFPFKINCLKADLSTRS